MKTLIPIILLIGKLTYSSGQVDGHEKQQLVLERGIVDSLFAFGKWTPGGQTETHLKYLGELTTTDGRTFKILNSIWFWGLSRHATERIIIFNQKNQFVGNYSCALPDKLVNGKLIFTNRDSQYCDKKLQTTVDLTNGLPKQFFIKCKDKYGDIYAFEPEW